MSGVNKGNALEELRSKIIASMGKNEPSSKPETSPGLSKENYSVHKNGNQQSKGFSSNTKQGFVDSRRGYRHDDRYQRSSSRYIGGNANAHYNQSPSQQPRQTGSRYGGGVRGGRVTQHRGNKYKAAELEGVTPIDKWQRKAPTMWDTTPEGFEKVAAERAKISGLFPQPGQPQVVDHYKLSRVALHAGTKSRRTRMLFEDTSENNLRLSRASTQLIVEQIKYTDGTDFASDVGRFKTGITNFIASLPETYKLVSFKTGADYAVLEFDSQAIATIVLSCQTYISKKMGVAQATWRRPHHYIANTNEVDELCDDNLIAIQDFPLTENMTHENIEQLLKQQDINTTYVKPIYCKNLQNTDTEPINESTNCILVLLKDDNDKKLLNKYNWLEPNQSITHAQDADQISFQSYTKIVKAQTKDQEQKPTTVLLLMNCVDPLDLKNVAFANEIKASISERLPNVTNIKINLPTADFRLNYDHLGKSIGNIYLKFDTTENAQAALKSLSGTTFNDRTILCCYFDDTDFDILHLL